MKVSKVKKSLNQSINELVDNKELFLKNAEKDFTRTRKISFKDVVSAILSFNDGTLNQELMDFFNIDPNIPTSSAFIQQRSKIKPDAFEFLFNNFTAKFKNERTYKGYHLLAIDGSDLAVMADKSDPDSYFPGFNGQKSYNLLHINAMYDVFEHIYSDVIVQKSRNENEHSALISMVDRSNIKNGLVIADRNYEAYNNMAHVQEKGWKFLFRVKDEYGIKSNFILPETDEFDFPIHLNLTRKKNKETMQLCNDPNRYHHIYPSTRLDYLPARAKDTKENLFFELSFRVVRFRLSDDSYETVFTNLDQEIFPAEEIKDIYALRWGIETSFRELKYTLGLLHLHSKKVELIYQEIFAKLTMYNFCQLITRSVIVSRKERAYEYKVNFSDAAHICLKYFHNKLAPNIVEATLLRYISPIRPGRNYHRKLKRTNSYSFIYRVA